MKRPLVVAGFCTLVGFVFLAHVGRTQNAQQALDHYLQTIGLGSPALESASKGRPVSALLPTANDRDLAVFGMIGVHSPPDTVRAHLLALERVLTVKGRRFHILGDPPTLSDVRDVEFAESEYRALQDCRPGDCDFKLPAAAMHVFIQQIDWSAPNAKAKVDELVRQGLLRLATEYRSRGNGATLPYDDVHGIRAGDVFLELAAQERELYDYAPELERYLRSYPRGRPKGVRDYLYWSEDRMERLRPTLTLNHVVVYASPGSPMLITRKQIYADHYYEGGFDMIAVVESGTSGDPLTYVLLVRRYRLDKLPGGVANIRGRARSQLLDATRSDLERCRATIESSPTR